MDFLMEAWKSKMHADTHTNIIEKQPTPSVCEDYPDNLIRKL